MATCVSQHSSRKATVSSLMLLAAVLMALLHSTTAFPHGYTCGTGHDHVHAQAQPEVVAQQYHTAEHVTDEAQRRRLAEIVSEPYRTGIGGSFLPLSVAAAAGLAGPIRIKFLWDVVEGGDYSGSKSGTSARQCTVAGGTITAGCQFSPAPCLELWVNGCGEEDVVTVGGGKLVLMKKHTDYVREYYAAALTVKHVQDSITLSSSTRSTYNIDTTSVSDADLVIIMTARPAPYRSIAGFAQCLQQDQHSRCTVGVFNWVPKVLDVAAQDEPSQIVSARHTALHEVIHVLGGIYPLGPHIDDNGNRKTTGVYVVQRDSVGYKKPATKIITPKVLKIAREQFGCQEMTGMPLEDQRTGKGAHWEARLMGPEVMSYGTGTGETYMSDLTFAYLEDTNQYIANYSLTGPLLETTGDTVQKKDFVVEASETPREIANRTRGQLRWGRGAGCSFVDGSAKTWPAQYTCRQNREFACSFDHRMSAVCDIRTWTLPSNREYTCGTYEAGASKCDKTLNDNCSPSKGCRLPTEYQFFDSASAQAAMGTQIDPSVLGGFSSAMDYVPQRIGYWSCQNTKPSNASSSQLALEAGDLDLRTITEGAEDEMRLFGGQAYCPECRCFVSSLMDFSSGKLNPKFPRFGLCYRSNCFRPDYLQFAIENQLGGTTWYKCPAAGGKMYIAGFSGAFHCPVAEDFCKYEEITGIKYEETSAVWEWVVGSIPFLLPVVLGMCLCCFGSKIDWAVGKLKHIIGVDFFENPGENDDETGKEVPPMAPAVALSFINVLTGLVGFGVLGLTVYSIATGRVSEAAYTLLSFSVFVIFVSCLGGCGAFKRAYYASCALLTYFYIVMFCAAVFFFFAAWAWFYTEAFDVWIAQRWDVVVDALPEDVLEKHLNHETASAIVENNKGIVLAISLTLLSLLIIGITTSVMIISAPVLLSSLFMMTNYSFIMTGLCVVGLGSYSIIFVSGLAAKLNILVALFVCLGLYIILNSTLGIVGGFKRSPILLKICFVMGLLSLVFQGLACAGLFWNTESAGNLVDTLSDDELARFTEGLGMRGMSKAELKIIMLVSNVYVILHLAHDLELELEEEGFDFVHKGDNRVAPAPDDDGSDSWDAPFDHPPPPSHNEVWVDPAPGPRGEF